MKMALVQGERICEFGTPFPVALGLAWVEVPNDTTTQDTYVNGSVVKWQPDPVTWGEIKVERDALLASCDWTQVTDSPLSANQKELWSAYRQLLRDLPETYSNVEDVVFPPTPGGKYNG